MAGREEIKSIMYIIANEYPDFIPGNRQMLDIKIGTWCEMLNKYDYSLLKQATLQMLSTFTYGTPKLAHLMMIIDPPAKERNEGMEFAVRLIDLSSKYGTNNIKEKVIDEFGKIGYSVYRQVKRELRELKIDDENVFKAQLRTLYNSLKEKEQQNNLDNLPYAKEAQKLIDNDVKEITTSMSLEKINKTN